MTETSMKKAAPALTAVLLLVLATACGGGNGSSSAPSSEEKAVIASVAKQVTTTDGLLDAQHAQCVATKFVTSVGVKRLQSSKAVGADDQYVANGALVDASTSAAYTKALLACVDEPTALTRLETAAEAGYGAQTKNILASGQVHCLISKFVGDLGVSKLFASRFVSDSGAFNGSGSAYDDQTAGTFADALVACVDYPKLQAQDAAAKNKKLSATKLATCLHQRISDAEVKATIVARLTGSSDADAQLAASNAKAKACEKVSRK
jgi:hypothetical protein